MTSTQQLRNWWAPPCRGPWVTVPLHGEGRVTVRASIVDAVRALNAVLVRWDYRTRRDDTGAFVCRRITGGTGYSLHAYGIALDINWSSNPYGTRLVTDMPRGMVNEILALRTNSGAQLWRWGGEYRSVKDAMHYEIFCAPSDVATGIAGTSPGPYRPPTKQPSPAIISEEDDDMAKLIRSDPTQGGNGAVIAVAGLLRTSVSAGDFPRWQFLTGGPGATVNVDAQTFEFFIRNTGDAKNIDKLMFATKK